MLFRKKNITVKDGYEMKRRSVSILTAFALTLALSPASVFAKSAPKPVPQPTNFTVVHEAKGDPNAKVEFIDPALLPSSSSQKTPEVDSGIISPMGTITEVYSHSYYVVDSNQITDYNCGPIDSQKFFLSVARGETKTIDRSFELSGTVTYEGSVGADIRQLINLSLTASVSGTVTGTWSTSTVYTGPDAPYLHRDYYAANQYDKYSNVVHRYDVYKVYNGSIYMYNETNDGGTSTYYAKKPKQITYSMDF